MTCNIMPPVAQQAHRRHHTQVVQPTWLDAVHEHNINNNISSEMAIAVARASVMIYDDVIKKWIPSGDSGAQGLSKVQIFQHSQNQTFRIVGRKLQGHEVTINCSISRGLRYNQATPTFHQWRDNRQVFGLNFASAEDAANFAQVLLRSLELVSAAGPSTPTPGGIPNGGPHHAASTPNFRQYPNGQDQGQMSQYASIEVEQQYLHQQQCQQDLMNRKSSHSVNSHQRRASQGSSGSSQSGSGGTPAGNMIYSSVGMGHPPPAPQQLQQPHQHSPARPAAPSGAPPPPPPPPPPAANMMMTQNNMNNRQHNPTAPVSGSAPPAPPPPPPTAMLKQGGGTAFGGAPSMAAALQGQQNKLRKTSMPSTQKELSAASVSNADGPSRQVTPPSASKGSKDSMLSEMAATLARRRALAEGTSVSEDAGSTQKKPWEPRNANGKTNGNTDSPRATRAANNTTIKRMPSGSSLSSQEEATTVGHHNNNNIINGNVPSNNNNPPTRAVKSSNGAMSVSPEQLEVWKLEIMADVRKEIVKAKDEIIEAIRTELNRR